MALQPLDILKQSLGSSVLAAYPDDTVFDAPLEIAALLIDINCFGALYPAAVGYLAAHLFVMGELRGGAGSAGPVTGLRAGMQAVNYGFTATSMRDDGMDTTTPGRNFLLIQRRVPCLVFSHTNPAFQRLLSEYSP